MIIAIAVAVCIWKNPFDYKAVVIVQQEQLNANSGPILTMPEATLLKSLREKGVLLTPSEYTNNIVSYYNTLIAFLSVFFVVFTIFGYYVVRNQSKKEVRDEARDILLESTTFKNQVIVNIRAHGWIPRIDVPLADSVFYYRERRADKNMNYAPQYTKVAQYVVADKSFPSDLDWNWGVQQIRDCAGGSKPGSAPSFWIAVRMNIHLAQQVKRLASL